MTLVAIKSATITEKTQVAIPKDLRKITGFKKGNKIAILAFEDHIEIRAMKDLNKKLQTAYASEKSLSKTWLSKKEDESWKDL